MKFRATHGDDLIKEEEEKEFIFLGGGGYLES